MRGVFLAAGLAVAALAAYMASNIIPASGVFLDLKPKLVDKCVRVDVFPGTEDVTIDPDTQLAFVSGADRRTAWAGGTPQRGGVFTLDLSDGYAVRRVSPENPADFQPHGISLWRGPDGDKRLFVVNHPLAGGHTVEIFDVGERGDLAHLESVSFPSMHSPNDVVGVGPRQFYATNDRGFTSGILETLEGYLSLPLASAVYFDGEHGRIIRKGLAYANGINISADGSTVYIAEFLGRRIGYYSRDIATGALKRQKMIKVNTGADNIEIANDGALWVGAHPKVFDFLKHARDPSAIAPSQVLRISPRTGDITEVFVDTTGKINGSSVGAVWDNTLIVGAVFDGHVMVCPMLEILLRPPPAGDQAS